LTEPAVVETTLASPLSLLIEEEEHGDRQAEEILLLSYTGDLGFFEAFALGVAQACGARVTVVDDAAVSTYDPRAVRRAGRSYLPGHAACEGAFHPKVVLIAGPSRVTAAIGSGNVTLAGWQANAELWTVLRGNSGTCPTVFADLARWLHSLPGHVQFSWGIPDALERTASCLEALAEKTAARADLGIRLVSTSTEPILKQLPQERVGELAVCAPFHDPDATALRELCERLQPDQLLVSYQSGLTQMDGPALAALIGEHNGQLRIDTETRYRHGKLIEWVIDGQRYALTGSPNLSSSALLRSLDDGGNCEIGLIAPIGQTLLPEGAEVPPAAVHAVHFKRRPPEFGGPLLLGATRTEEGVHVLCVRPLPSSGYLEISHAAAPPEVWERAADVPAGSTDLTVTVAADGGSRVRLVTNRSDGPPRYSNVVPVVDPGRAVRRPGITTAHVPTTRPDDLFSDPRLAERFFADLATLRTGLSAPPKAASGSGGKGTGSAAPAEYRSNESWDRYLDECAGRIGHPLLRFALGLPMPEDSEPGYDSLLTVSWDEQFADDAEVGLEEDAPEAVAEERAGEPAPMPPALPDLRRGVSELVRRRYQRWAERLTDAAGRLGTPERMLVTRLLLWTAAAGAWDNEDHTWVALLAESVSALGETDLSGEVEPQIASLAAVALSVLRSQAPRHIHTDETMAYQHAASAVAHLLPAAEIPYIDEYCQLLDTAFGSAVDPEVVQLHAAEVVQADPVADAVWTLAEIGRDAHRHGDRLLHVTGRFANPVLAAMEAVAAAQEARIVGAWATAASGKWALSLWRKPDLVVIDKSGPVKLWRHYRLTGLITPSGLAAQRSFDGAITVRHGPFMNPFQEAVDLLSELGLASPDPPSDCGSAP
jgi:hypothetical protein